MRKQVLFFFFLLSFIGISAQMSSKKWKKDIEYLQTNLTNKHYNLFAYREQVLFDKDINMLISDCEKLSDFQIAVRIQQILSKQGDTHTKISWEKLIDNSKAIPLLYYYFKDGIYVTLTNSENKDVIGKKVVSINNYDIKTVTDSLSTLIAHENDAIVKARLPNLVSSIEILNYFGFANDDTIKVKFQDGKNFIEKKLSASKIRKSEKVTINPPQNTFVRENKKKIFEKKYFEKEKILYVLYNSCVSKEEPSFLTGKPEATNLPSFIDFQNDIFKIIDTNPIEKLVFDMRNNKGGSSKQGSKFIKQLAQNSNINKKGHLFVVLGRDTFSSAILNATDFEEETKAIFVGEETSGKPNHYGEIKDFELPNSKLILTYSTYYFVRTKKKNVNSLKPDYTIESTIEDHKNGIDPVFEFVKNYK